ncbi:hypothetical protein [Paracoccus marinaquae]|uniref:Uncharacterized protein n=1 Tax=Paracoccus marinaquae TaxID=2841926 RepID=A0ABS6AFG9_9RHOB|nr:hypothetical protein [Paracoccus marinaquae]MBU3028961.1 hypothetical protein [Paracoccus marinaquae]
MDTTQIDFTRFSRAEIGYRIVVVPGGGFEPPTRGFSIRHEIQENQRASVSKAAPTNRELNENVSNAYLTGANENPDALAGAIGADLHSWFEWIDTSTRREAAARGLLEAVLACDRRDRVPLMERFIEALRPGQPVPAFDSVMAEASHWADWASAAELKAYALACYTRLSASDQHAFLGYVQGRAAA